MKKNLGVLMMVVMMICAVVFPSFGTTKVVSAKEYTYVKIFIDCKSIVPKAFVGSKIYIGTDVAVITADGDDARLSEICKQTFTVTEKNHGYFSAKLLILADESKNNESIDGNKWHHIPPTKERVYRVYSQKRTNSKC